MLAVSLTGQQYKCPHSVMTGSTQVQRQMLHEKSASPSSLAAGEDIGLKSSEEESRLSEGSCSERGGVKRVAWTQGRSRGADPSEEHSILR